MAANVGEPVTRTRAQIALVSALLLFLELALIRWLPANVYTLAFFSNLVLLGAFFGFGFGILTEKRLPPSLLFAWPWLLLAVIALVLVVRTFDVLVPPESTEWIWSSYRPDQLSIGSVVLPLEPTLVACFACVAIVFVPLGRHMATLMTRVPSLSFYTWDLAGSVIGILVFSALSAGGTSPTVWFVVVAVAGLSVLRLATPRRAHWLSGLIALAGVVALVSSVDRDEIWSPYYSIQTRPEGDQLKVYVNRLYHQEAINFRHSEIGGYQIPYRFFHGGDVLVVGAGTGNDVAVALSHDARSVDAVEIDREIQRLGAEHHPLKPYSDPRVTPVIQDARSYFQTCRKQYDLVVFGTLDSHALLSSVSSLRLDNYVYTVEAIEAASRLVRPGGHLAMLYSVPTQNEQRLQWIQARLEGMVAAVFGRGEVVAFHGSSEFLNLVVVAQRGVPFGPELSRFKVAAPGPGDRVPRDDWPFLYLETNRPPRHTMVVIAALLALVGGSVLAALPRSLRRPRWGFLALGVGFMLLETAAITRMSLLFGSTWIVNVVVFTGVLLMVLAANLVAARVERLPIHVAYALLVSSLVGAYLFDLRWVLFAPFAVRLVVAVGISGLPLFFAGLVFSDLFKGETGDGAVQAFGFNLVGAMIGGLAEHVGVVIGLDQLLLVAAFVYGLAWLGTARAVTGAASIRRASRGAARP